MSSFTNYSKDTYFSYRGASRFPVDLPVFGWDENWNPIYFYPAFHINWGWGGYSDGWYSTPSGNKYTDNVELFSNLSKKN